MCDRKSSPGKLVQCDFVTCAKKRLNICSQCVSLSPNHPPTPHH